MWGLYKRNSLEFGEKKKRIQCKLNFASKTVLLATSEQNYLCIQKIGKLAIFFTWLKFRLIQNVFDYWVTLENYIYSVRNYKTTLLDTVHFFEMKTIYLASYDRSAQCAKIFQMIPRISFGLVLVSVLYSDTENRCYNEYSSVVLCVVVRCVVQTSLSYKVYIAVG